jgi:hypothetical protein
VDQTSFGGYGWVSVILDPKRPDPKAKGLITAGFALLSGDDPSTLDKNEGWNPLFSRYPKWSELYVYSMAAETAGRPAYATNTLNPYVKFDRTLHKKVSFQGVLYHYRALQARKFRDGSTSGKTRGSEVQALFQFTFNKYVTGHFLFDRFFSGDFYQAPRANGSFIRGELMIRY